MEIRNFRYKSLLRNPYAIWLLCFMIYLLVVYFAYIARGGFIVDDWGVIIKGNMSFVDNISSWFPLFSNRPLAPLLLAIITTIFKTSPVGYITLNVGLWSAAVVIMGYILKRHLGYKFLTFFSILAVLPIVATSFMFSPGMQVMNSFSVFLWALSFLSLDKYLRSRRKVFYILTYGLILTSLFTYEVTLPLLVITALYPFYLNSYSLKQSKRDLFHYFLKYILPVILAVGMVFIYQKIIIPEFMITYSRLPSTPLSYFTGEGIEIGLEWLLNLIIGVPVLLYSSLRYHASLLSYPEMVVIIILLTTLIAAFIKRRDLFKMFENRSDKSRPTTLIVILVLSFLSASMLFILSTNHPEISSYPNRGFSTSWLLLCVVLGIIAYYGKSIVLIVLSVFFVLTLNTYLIQRNNYIDSYTKQLNIVDSCIADLHQQEAPSRAIVLGYVPVYLTDNFDNENVFSEPWDFGNALRIRSNDYVVDGNLFTLTKKSTIVNDKIDMTEGWTASINQNLWYCEYRQDNSNSEVEKIDSAAELQEIIDQIKADEGANSPTALYPVNIVKGVINGMVTRNLDNAIQNLKNLKNYFINLNRN